MCRAGGMRGGAIPVGHEADHRAEPREDRSQCFVTRSGDQGQGRARAHGGDHCDDGLRRRVGIDGDQVAPADPGFLQASSQGAGARMQFGKGDREPTLMTGQERGRLRRPRRPPADRGRQ